MATRYASHFGRGAVVRGGEGCPSEHPLYPRGCIPNFIQFVVAIALYVVNVLESPSTNERLAQFSWMRPCEHIPLNIVHYSAFFLKKDGTKKDFRASGASPEAYPASDVHPSARQSTTFCRFVCVTKYGQAVGGCRSPAPTRSDIGI